MSRRRGKIKKKDEHDVSVRDRILDRTIFLMSKKGTTDVSVREIAREAGVNVAAVNYYFSSKEQMFDQMAERFLGGYDRVMGILDEPELSSEERLRKWAETVMRYLEEYPGCLVLMERYMFAEPLDPFGRALRAAMQRAVRKLRETLAECFGQDDDEKIAFKLTLLISALSGPFPHRAERPTTKQRIKGPSARKRFLELLFEHLRR
jgi:AcrR family transcriptional regulator